MCKNVLNSSFDDFSESTHQAELSSMPTLWKDLWSSEFHLWQPLHLNKDDALDYFEFMLKVKSKAKWSEI